MDNELISELHEITRVVKLTDSAPITDTVKGLPFKPERICLYFVRENASNWELMGVELRGTRVITEKGKPGYAMGKAQVTRPYWSEIKNLPEWMREIVARNIPATVQEWWTS